MKCHHQNHYEKHEYLYKTSHRRHPPGSFDQLVAQSPKPKRIHPLGAIKGCKKWLKNIFFDGSEITVYCRVLHYIVAFAVMMTSAP